MAQSQVIVMHAWKQCTTSPFTKGYAVTESHVLVATVAAMFLSGCCVSSCYDSMSYVHLLL